MEPKREITLKDALEFFRVEDIQDARKRDKMWWKVLVIFHNLPVCHGIGGSFDDKRNPMYWKEYPPRRHFELHDDEEGVAMCDRWSDHIAGLKLNKEIADLPEDERARIRGERMIRKEQKREADKRRTPRRGWFEI